jgi:hypothetical protein
VLLEAWNLLMFLVDWKKMNAFLPIVQLE